jgi:hypothetical protein
MTQMRSTCTFNGLVALGFLAACSANDTRIDGHQYAQIDPDNEKRVALLLASHVSCDERDQSCTDPQGALAELQAHIEGCIARGLKNVASNVTLVERHAWANSGTTVSLDEVLITDEHRQLVGHQELQAHELDYVVRLGVTSNRSSNRLLMEGGGDSGGGILLVGQEWTKTTQINAGIFSVNTGALVGELHADLSAESGWFVPVLLIVPVPVPVPLPPAGWSGRVESNSCVEMGEALGRFFSGAGNSYVR